MAKQYSIRFIYDHLPGSVVHADNAIAYADLAITGLRESGYRRYHIVLPVSDEPVEPGEPPIEVTAVSVPLQAVTEPEPEPELPSIGAPEWHSKDEVQELLNMCEHYELDATHLLTSEATAMAAHQVLTMVGAHERRADIAERRADQAQAECNDTERDCLKAQAELEGYTAAAEAAFAALTNRR